jgi:probable DNA metabolism protein
VIVLTWIDTIYQYDGTFEGFLCCVFESYVHKEFPTAFYSDGECIFSLYEIRNVLTEPENARRVYRSLAKYSPAAGVLLRKGFLTCMEEKESRLYALIRKIYAEGIGFLRNRSDEVAYPVLRAIRHLDGELEKYRGFVRFSDYGRMLGGEIEPKNQVLPLLRGHFCARYANESFFLYDRTHGQLLLYSGGKSRLVNVDSVELADPCTEEYLYRNLWKKFYDTVEIKPRHNPRCQNTQMPKRYRGMMTEFQPEAYFRPKEAPAALQGRGVPDAKPALEKHAESAPSAPVSAP